MRGKSASMGKCDLLGEREPNACTAGFGREKGDEDIGEQFIFDSVTIVADLDDQGIGIVDCGQSYDRLRDMLDRVSRILDQVDNGLFYQSAVEAGHRIVTGVDLEKDRSLPQLRADQLV